MIQDCNNKGIIQLIYTGSEHNITHVATTALDKEKRRYIH